MVCSFTQESPSTLYTCFYSVTIGLCCECYSNRSQTTVNSIEINNRPAKVCFNSPACDELCFHLSYSLLDVRCTDSMIMQFNSVFQSIEDSWAFNDFLMSHLLIGECSHKEF